MPHICRRSRLLAVALGAVTAFFVLLGPKFAWSFLAPRGATYTVAPDGDDRDDGSDLHPWKTLQHAAQRVLPGDTVNVRPGKYAGFALGWDGPQGGTAAQPITFRGQSGAVIAMRNTKTPDGILLDSASYVIIEGFTITNDGSIRRAGIRSVRNRGVVLRGNKVEGIVGWGIYTSFSDGVLIENNIATRSVKEHGIYVSNTTDRPVIRGNTVAHNSMCGIHMNGDVSQGGSGVISGALVENNVAYANGKKGGSGINADGVQNSIFQNNLLYDSHSSGISLYRTDAGVPSRYNLVINNTVVVAADGRWALNIQNGSTGNTAYNNILCNYHRRNGSIKISPDSLPGFLSDHNVVVSRFTMDDDNLLNLAQWQERTGRDQHSLTATPEQLFRNPKGGDFGLAAGSPAIDAGTARRAPSADRLGDRRPWGEGFDIGAHEAQEKGPAILPPASAAPPAPRPTPVRIAPEPVKSPTSEAHRGAPQSPPVLATPVAAPSASHSDDSLPKFVSSPQAEKLRRLEKKGITWGIFAFLSGLSLVVLAGFGAVWFRRYRRGGVTGFARPPPEGQLTEQTTRRKLESITRAAGLQPALAVWALPRYRAMHRWLVPYIGQSHRRRAPTTGEPVHVLLCVADHFEPRHGGVSAAVARARLKRWVEEYPRLFGQMRDSDGRPPRHTFFYPVEQYDPKEVQALARLFGAGYGEIEVHLHHDGDTADTLRDQLLRAKKTLAGRHGLLARRRGGSEVAYGFVHGDWALNNSRPDGRCCGVNNEVRVLRETGCYADFTMPSAPDPTQAHTINSIYYACGDPDRPRCHDVGIGVGVGAAPENALMLIQGPLMLNWRRRKWGLVPRLDNGCLQNSLAPSLDRLDLWLRARVQVPSRPDWFFVKLHTHGAPEANQRVLLGDAMVLFHRALAARAKTESNFHFHYVTAREMYNLARAAESGWKGSVEEARDHELVCPRY
jgi:parallel beta-helix repeat protein